VSSDRTDTSVVVIGGGQAGLSVSYYLKRLGLDPGNEFVVLDRGPGAGGAWQHRWDALRIGSAHRINDLPGMDSLGVSFETADRSAPARDVVADYYARYEEFHGFQVVRPARVTRVENTGRHMAVTFDDGVGEQVVTTEIVVNATGTWGSPFIPWYPGRDSFAGRQLHTAEYSDAADFAGMDVIVVGGGTSAIGFLLELEPEAASTTWVSRRPVEFLEDGELNLEARVSAVAMQDEAARAGRALPSIVSGTGVPRTRRIAAGIERGVLTTHPMFSSIEPDGVRWPDGSFQKADAIIWATGFRPELRHLAALKLREREGGIVVAGGSSWKEPRIFFAGYGPQASTIGANRAGRSIARQAVATLSRLKRLEREELDLVEARARDELRMRQASEDAASRAAAAPAPTKPVELPQRVEPVETPPAPDPAPLSPADAATLDHLPDLADGPDPEELDDPGAPTLTELLAHIDDAVEQHAPQREEPVTPPAEPTFTDLITVITPEESEPEPEQAADDDPFAIFQVDEPEVAPAAPSDEEAFTPVSARSQASLLSDDPQWYSDTDSPDFFTEGDDDEQVDEPSGPATEKRSRWPF
jgi:cation diffusion facilitator CzcD-associated flavoprotein CzcO